MHTMDWCLQIHSHQLECEITKCLVQKISFIFFWKIPLAHFGMEAGQQVAGQVCAPVEVSETVYETVRGILSVSVYVLFVRMVCWSYLVFMVDCTPALIIVSVPVGGLNFMVVPTDGAFCQLPKALAWPNPPNSPCRVGLPANKPGWDGFPPNWTPCWFSQCLTT